MQFYSAGSVSAALTVLVRFIVEEQDMELSFRRWKNSLFPYSNS